MTPHERKLWWSRTIKRRSILFGRLINFEKATNMLSQNDAYWAKRLQRSKANFIPSQFERRVIPPKTTRFQMTIQPIESQRTWFVRFPKRRPMTAMEKLNEIKRAVNNHTIYDWHTIASDVRKRQVVRVRQAAMAVIRKHTTWSYSQMARHFGNRDHATIIHACRKVATYPERFADLVEMMEAEL